MATKRMSELQIGDVISVPVKVAHILWHTPSHFYPERKTWLVRYRLPFTPDAWLVQWRQGKRWIPADEPLWDHQYDASTAEAYLFPLPDAHDLRVGDEFEFRARVIKTFYWNEHIGWHVQRGPRSSRPATIVEFAKYPFRWHAEIMDDVEVDVISAGTEEGVAPS